MSINHEYKVTSMESIREDNGLEYIVSTVHVQLTSSEVVTHNIEVATYYDENDNELDEPIITNETITTTVTKISEYISTLDTSNVSADTFTEYDSLLESVVLEWVSPNLEIEASHESYITKEKDKLINPKKYEISMKSLPWV